jgi:long-chain fatty acid transport protein
LEAGIAYKPFSNITLAIDIAWLNYKDTVYEGVIALTTPAGLEFLNATNNFLFHWEDMTVIAAGIDFLINQGISIQLGYNYASSPVPDDYLNPLFPSIFENHISAGLTLLTEGGIEFQFALAFSPENEVVYTNINMPFGQNATESVSALSLLFGVIFPI